MFDSRKKIFEAAGSYNSVLDLSFGIHSSLTNGIPSYRAVFYNTEARNTNGETLTDNVTVSYSGTPGAVPTAPAGVVKDGSGLEYVGLTLLPGCNRDLNVTVTTIGTMMLEVEAASIVTIGSTVSVNAVGQAVATGGTTTGFRAITAASGTGTTGNPEFITVLIK
jgi:hypothetical protein